MARFQKRCYMRLHEDIDVFEELIQLTSKYTNLPEMAIRRDYFITWVLLRLSQSEFVDSVIFKGGTSLSKCYPNSIERFSEDIDLTFISHEELSLKKFSKQLKEIEKVLIAGNYFEPINYERNDTNKCGYIWFDSSRKEEEKIKLEIGSSGRPDPYSKKVLKSYIQDYLISIDEHDTILEYNLCNFEINVLSIERTFVDKLFAIKRHAMSGTLNTKSRHIYDVVKLFQMNEIKTILADDQSLKRIISVTKKSDYLYFEKREVPKEYDPTGKYHFSSWEYCLNDEVKSNYEMLHKELLFTNEKQDMSIAISVLKEISRIFDKLDT